MEEQALLRHGAKVAYNWNSKYLNDAFIFESTTQVVSGLSQFTRESTTNPSDSFTLLLYRQLHATVTDTIEKNSNRL